MAPPRPPTHLKPSSRLADVRYDIRGPLARRALELEKSGKPIIKLNIGNPGAFGFAMPEHLRRAVAEHIPQSEAYAHQKGILPAREAIVEDQRHRGVRVAVDDVFVGNGVSELIISALRGLLDDGDEVLVPSPDYPLWTAAVTLNGGRAVHYPCPREQGFLPDLERLRALVTPRTRALVIITPNNPTGAVYPRPVLEAMVALAEEHGLVVFSDEIYDRILYDGAEHVPVATLVQHTLCGTFGGLSKVHRGCGLRVGWLSFSGARAHADEYLQSLDLLASLRLCGNVTGQWTVPAALGGPDTISALTAPGGRLYQTRQAILAGTRASAYLDVVAPQGAMYAFVRAKRDRLPEFDDQRFALDLLERRQVLIVPGSSFNVAYRDHFRITLLPDEAIVADVFGRMESLLDEYAAARSAKA
ncbi:MAG: aminotransferase class I/II-fold pyridoxal phosphate-dependent enzyme [Planctomycetes bacterium]|nr:aminotransferase class I/II-fold pyridoxal phosphate-dependent enzyme [Planctomycetota bacterium]